PSPGHDPSPYPRRYEAGRGDGSADAPAWQVSDERGLPRTAGAVSQVLNGLAPARGRGLVAAASMAFGSTLVRCAELRRRRDLPAGIRARRVDGLVRMRQVGREARAGVGRILVDAVLDVALAENLVEIGEAVFADDRAAHRINSITRTRSASRR